MLNNLNILLYITMPLKKRGHSSKQSAPVKVPRTKRSTRVPERYREKEDIETEQELEYEEYNTESNEEGEEEREEENANSDEEQPTQDDADDADNADEEDETQPQESVVHRNRVVIELDEDLEVSYFIHVFLFIVY